MTLIDFAVFASKAGNPFLKELLAFYDTIELPKNRKDFRKCFITPQVKVNFKNRGVEFDGRIQVFGNGMVVFPPTFFIPQDHVVFDKPNITEDTYTFHHDYFSWGEGVEVSQKHKKENNRKLRQIFASGGFKLS